MVAKEESNWSRDSTRKLRTIKALRSQIDWLSWPIVWNGKNIEFKDPKRGSVIPDSDALIKAKRNINNIIRDEATAKRVIDKLRPWKDEFDQLLARAKYVAALQETDFTKLVKRAKARDKSAIPQLIDWIEAESLVENLLPESPTRLLADFGIDSKVSIEEYLSTQKRDPRALALAALCLGLIQTDLDVKPVRPLDKKQEHQDHKGWHKDCLKWGAEFGRDIDPSVAVAILGHNNGSSTLKQLRACVKKAIRLPISDDTIKRMVVQKKQKVLLDAFKEVNEFEAVVEQILSSYQPSSEQSSLLLIDSLPKLVDKCVRDANSADAISTMRELLLLLLERFRCDDAFITQVHRAIGLGAELDGDLRDQYFKLLIDYSNVFWVGPTTVETGPKPCPNCGAFHEYPPAPQLIGANAAAPDRPEVDDNTGQDTEEQDAKEGDAEPTLPSIRQGVEAWGSKMLDTSLALLAGCRDGRLVGLAIEHQVQGIAVKQNIESADQLRLVVDMIDRLNITKTLGLSQVCFLVALFSDPTEARSYLEPFIREVEKAPYSMREHIFEVADEVRSFKKTFRTSISALTRFVPFLINGTNHEYSDRCLCDSLSAPAMKISKYAPKFESELFQTLVAEFDKRRLTGLDMFDVACSLAIAFIRANVSVGHMQGEYGRQNETNPSAVLSQAIEIFANHEYRESQFFQSGLDVLRKQPAMCHSIARQYKLNPKRINKLIESLGIAHHFGVEAMKPLERLRRYRQVIKIKPVDRHALKRLYAKGWGVLLLTAPQMVPHMMSYMLSRSITGDSQGPPNRLLRLIHTRKDLQEEKAFLEERLMQTPTDTKLIKRFASLQTRLDDEGQLAAYVKKTVSKHLVHLAEEAELEALEHVMQDIFHRQLKRITGSLPDDLEIDSYLLNALMLTQDIIENNRLLKKLIRAHVEGDKDWRMRIPKNAEFIQSLREAEGVNADLWLSPFQKTFRLKPVAGEIVKVRLETDPLHVLEMGNYFDTCLSFLGINSFSTVVNACDLNKRVAYAYDHESKVIGRKLIAINSANKVVGFRTYTTLDNNEARTSLSMAMDESLRDFASSCGLQLDNDSQSTIPVLSASSDKNWFNDGIVDWLTGSAVQVSRKHAKLISSTRRQSSS
ncbi:MAG: hypothetical protein K2X93_15385 [Candidatus Obscuribacterales bacterium]|nr:hypothetical protein [Candidatus Obscuribacterales bacterium]